MHEVHRPAVIGFFRDRQRLRFGPYQPFSRLYPQIKFKGAINPVHPLVVPAKAFDVTQVQKAQSKTLSIPSYERGVARLSGYDPPPLTSQ